MRGSPGVPATSPELPACTVTFYRKCSLVRLRAQTDKSQDPSLRPKLVLRRLYPGMSSGPYRGVISGKRTRKPLRLGIETFGRVRAFITRLESISLFSARI